VFYPKINGKDINMKAVKAILLILIFFVLMPAWLICQLYYSLYFTLLNTDYYLDLFEKMDVYTKTADIFLGGMKENSSGLPPEVIIKMEELFTPELMKDWVLEVVPENLDNARNFFMGNGKELDISFNIQKLKERLLKQVIENFPPQIVYYFEDSMALTPDFLNLKDEFPPLKDFEQQYLQIRGFFIIPIILLIAAILISFLIMGLKNIKGGLLYNGIILSIVALLLLGIFSLIDLIMSEAMKTFDTTEYTEYTTKALNYFFELVNAVLYSLRINQVLFAVTGLLLIVAGIIAGRKKPEETEKGDIQTPFTSPSPPPYNG
jgi:hypothetical protein